MRRKSIKIVGGDGFTRVVSSFTSGGGDSIVSRTYICKSVSVALCEKLAKFIP